MAIYAIGDIQGCYDSFQRLLEKVDFSPENDQLWLVGDLVNRGKKSLKTLRFVKSLGDSAITVLGNHDVSLLAMHYGIIPPSPTLKKTLKSKHCEELVDWLRQRPIMHVDQSLGFCMAHAGISAAVDLRSKQLVLLMKLKCPCEEMTPENGWQMFMGNKPNLWSDELQSYERHRYIVNAFMRMRYCSNKDGSLDFKLNGVPKIKKSDTVKKVPWFMWKNRKEIPLRIIFGHWSS